ncbi:phage tail protein [Rhodospirillum sp. A1_3_36]|uniref:phage tail protein n=1 Tax=Rhodospirillum sp. A1_3_36 TaxID=3391666 RepID=UPI0039A74D28
MNQIALSESDLPKHTHEMTAGLATGPNMVAEAKDNFFTRYISGSFDYAYTQGDANTTMSKSALSSAGGGQKHENRQPYLALGYYIAYDGVFPAFE